MLDLQQIKDRLFVWNYRTDAHLPRYDAELAYAASKDLAALVAEVERLREELSATQALADSYGEWSHKMEAEADRLGAAIDAHRKTTILRLGGASPWATDHELWEVLND